MPTFRRTPTGRPRASPPTILWTSAGDMPPSHPFPPHHPAAVRRAAGNVQGRGWRSRRRTGGRNRQAIRSHGIENGRDIGVWLTERRDWDEDMIMRDDTNNGWRWWRRRRGGYRRRRGGRELSEDGWSYEEFLRLEEGNVRVGMEDEEFEKLEQVKAKKGAVCHICLEEAEEGEDGWVRLECGHEFDRECIWRWLKTKRTCPTCRGAV